MVKREHFIEAAVQSIFMSLVLKNLLRGHWKALLMKLDSPKFLQLMRNESGQRTGIKEMTTDCPNDDS